MTEKRGWLAAYYGAAGDDASRDRQSVGDDEEAFRRLFTRYHRPLLLFFTRRGFSADESGDLIQETFLRVYRALPRFRGDASFQTWLFQIATNIWRNELRRRYTAKRAGAETSLEDVINAESDLGAETDEETEAEGQLAAAALRQAEWLEDILAQERTRLLRHALAGLPPQMRRCVMLRVGQDLKYREIAEIMQISIETVKSQLSQAKARLREELGHQFPDLEIR
jgi:RNA polymerase sigma-70 factor, ECF subfamily